ncbi:MAG: LysR family transcriptional regulator [Arthrobacter sp.]|uniref:LysR family transcriptional regulator n=1 Tax=Arthrobacter sp. TaxID=1667 RepID=UPI003492EA31
MEGNDADRGREYRVDAPEAGVSQAAVSRNVAALERALDVRLLRRATRSVEPAAAAGERTIRRARRILASVGELEREAPAEAGTVRIGYAWSALGPPPELQLPWASAVPHSELRLVRSNTPTAGLTEGAGDLAILRRVPARRLWCRCSADTRSATARWVPATHRPDGARSRGRRSRTRPWPWTPRPAARRRSSGRPTWAPPNHPHGGHRGLDDPHRDRQGTRCHGRVHGIPAPPSGPRLSAGPRRAAPAGLRRVVQGGPVQGTAERRRPAGQPVRRTGWRDRRSLIPGAWRRTRPPRATRAGPVAGRGAGPSPQRLLSETGIDA